MADRKARSFTFKTPPGVNLGVIRAAIEGESNPTAIKVFQQISASEYLVELSNQDLTEELIENGFTAGDHHINCHPPHGYYLNVSIMGLKAYVADDEVTTSLQQYGEVKSSVIRLKYRSDHELAGLENGNRLIKMILTAPSIPYSLRIGGEWCRIIHNNQQRVCTNCQELGHTRKHCPTIECRRCHEQGHLSFNCPQITSERDRNVADNTADDTTPMLTEPAIPPPIETTTTSPDVEQPSIPADQTHETPDSPVQEDPTSGHKRQLTTDSDSDNSIKPQQRRPRLNPAPNLQAARSPKNTTTKDTAKDLNKKLSSKK